MLEFTIDEKKCTYCGFCANDCPAGIVDMNTVYPAIASEQEAVCLKCQHCLAARPIPTISIVTKIRRIASRLTGIFLTRIDSKPLSHTMLFSRPEATIGLVKAANKPPACEEDGNRRQQHHLE